jgi:hypothetical protein
MHSGSPAMRGFNHGATTALASAAASGDTLGAMVSTIRTGGRIQVRRTTMTTIRTSPSPPR